MTPYLSTLAGLHQPIRRDIHGRRINLGPFWTPPPSTNPPPQEQP